MKIFYTVRDIEDMHAAGVTEIVIHDDVVLTDVAREKAIALGMQLKPVEQAKASRPVPGTSRADLGAPTNARPAGHGASSPAAPPAPAPANPGPAAEELVRKIKAAVVARLGTDKYNDLLDTIIPQVMAKIKK